MDPASSPAAAGAHEDPFGDVFLVVDGFGSIREDFDALEQPIMNLAVQGLSYGVHVVIALNRWAQARPALKDQIATRIELRLGDPMDSDLGRKVAALVPQGRPGRGMTAEGLHMLTALPRIDGSSNPVDLGTGVANAVSTLAAMTRGRSAPPVRMLPSLLPREQLLSMLGQWPVRGTGPNLRIPVGINESELAPVALDFVESPHFLVFGDTECGKTTLLRNIVDGICATNTPEQARIILCDYRRTLIDLAEIPHRAAYASAAPMFATNIKDLVSVLQRRVPDASVTAQQLRERSWWSGAEVFVVVDDYDLVATSTGNPLSPILEFLPLARDIGLHLIVARRSGGAGRAMFEPIISRMKDLACAGLVMSGSRDEGALLGGIRPTALPPGRGSLATRGGIDLVQVAWMPPS
jgi:S-DNA-T family DNA segregation ATPase FtsK/SpoIIIE